MSDKIERAELADLLKLSQFRSFLFRLIQSAGILASTTNGSDGRNLIHEGRRNLGLDILHDAARGMPVDDPEAAFGLLLIQVLREGAQTSPQEKRDGRTGRYKDEPTDED